MGYSARVVLDSISPAGHRLTTLEVTFPRFVLAELNTHRAFCLAGDASLEFELPSGLQNGRRKVYNMTVREFVEKWADGAAPRVNKSRKPIDRAKIDPATEYTGWALAEITGFHKSNLHAACRTGALSAYKRIGGRQWIVRGSAFLDWLDRPATNRQPIAWRLKGMQIRQVDEATGEVRLAKIANAFRSGEKHVFEVVAEGGYRIAGSRDHRVLTVDGWKTIGELTESDELAIQKRGKPKEQHADSKHLRKINGKWRSIWQRKQFSKAIASDPNCRICLEKPATEIHHIIPVHERPDLAFDEWNVKAICGDCHEESHRKQGWQTGVPLYVGTARVKSVTLRGIEQTYDLSIAGPFPNFFANKIVVHNSRNSASSRAVPIAKMVQRVLDDPVMPLEWGSNKPGMQAGEPVDATKQAIAQKAWLAMRDQAVGNALMLSEQGVHKQIVNRLLEPFLWHTALITSTEWKNFFEQRISPLAQPEMRHTAELMKAALDASTPTKLFYDGWHAPFLTGEEREDIDKQITAKLSVARCARVSYLNHDGVPDPEKDLALFEKLVAGKHLSPFEHVAQPTENRTCWANFRGWKQLRWNLEQGWKELV